VTALSMRPLLLPPVSFQAVTITYAHSELPTTAGREVAADVTLPGHDRPPIALEAVTSNLPEALILDGPFGNGPHHTTSSRSGQPREGSAIYHLFSTSAYFVVGRRILIQAAWRSEPPLGHCALPPDFRGHFTRVRSRPSVRPSPYPASSSSARILPRAISISLVPDDVAKVEALAEAKGLSYTALLRMRIKEADSIGSET
jgi:hypothetical protein